MSVHSIASPSSVSSPEVFPRYRVAGGKPCRVYRRPQNSVILVARRVARLSSPSAAKTTRASLISLVMLVFSRTVMSSVSGIVASKNDPVSLLSG